MPEIIFLPKEKLYPRFGYALPLEQVAYVRKDLPGPVREFVTFHELYHLNDTSRWWVWREVKANVAAALKHPLGFIICVIMSLAPYRLKYYWKRLNSKA
ncbi:MAG: hypothetical protein JSU72_00340 [Deltaproteobacteria bacterium]|nr:MAG: hypothetical protein JSU72_00340 [Deltaproteobacteria bacterium]